ncbi:MAG: MATE family efflux transporter [Bacteroidales bacterium]|nr:MATE family efflux transporter [Bacteroidales bacterium]
MEVSLSGHYGYRRLLTAAAPSVAMMLVSSVYGIVDGLFVSNFAGKSGFAAVNLMYPPMMILGAMGLMVGSGGAALVGKVQGEGYPQKADRVFTMLLRFLAVVGIAVGVLFAVFCPVVARWLGADEGMMEECITYGRISMVGMPFFMLQQAMQSFYMAAERPQLGTWVSVACGVVNIVFDALFVWLMKWGVAGAAWATVLAQVVGGGFPLLYFGSRRLNKGSLHLRRNSKTLWPYVGKACTNGLSEYVSGISLSIVSMCYNLQLMRYLGEDGVAAYGVVMYLTFVIAAFFIGYNITLTPIIGYHFGARDVAEQRSLLRKSLVIIGLTGLVLTAVAETASSPAARFFVGYDEGLLALTIKAIRVYMLCFLICGWSMFASALFTGLQNGVVSAVAAFMRSLVFEMAAVWILPAVVGIDGIWWAVNVAEVLTLLFCIFLVWRYAPQLITSQSISR